jgi:uncharacterized YkwD family protein
MKFKWTHWAWNSLICVTLVAIPTSTAWGFGTATGIVDNLTPTNYPITGLTADEKSMINLVNQARIQAGLHSLISDSSLTQTARLKSQDMVNLNYFAHESPTFGSPFEMMSKFGIAFQTAGENIACNQSVAAAYQALMNSQGHRENILNESFVYIGIGIVGGGPCGQMYTQQFVGR